MFKFIHYINRKMLSLNYFYRYESTKVLSLIQIMTLIP